MDANGTRFHLLLGYEDWAACIDGLTLLPLRQSWEATSPPVSDAAGLAWDGERYQLTLQPHLVQFKAAPRDTAPALSSRRGAGSDRYGNWYWIGESGRELFTRPSGIPAVTSHFWSPGDGTACAPTERFGDFRPMAPAPAPSALSLSGLAVTDDHYLVVGALDPAGLLIFDLTAGGPPRQVFWPPSIPLVPFDMAPAPGGGVWILDREHGRYWALDRQFNVLARDQEVALLLPEQTDPFQPVDHSSTRRTAARSFPQGITLAAASPVAASDPVAIEALPDGTVLILDRNPGEAFSLVFRYRFGQQVGQPVSTESMLALIEETEQPGFRLVGYDFAFVPEHQESDGLVLDRLYIVGSDGNQAYAFTLSLQGEQLAMEPLHDFLPMRLYGGKALVAAGNYAYYDFSDRWIPLVVQQRARYEPEATLYTPLGGPRHAFDGREPDCVWHRLMLDACIPGDTEVQVWSRAANAEDDLTLTTWQQEPGWYFRSEGSELPFVQNPAGANNGTWELLFQRARGRYLQLKLTITGNGRITPRLRALRIYYPRFSYLTHYLPAVYREDQDSASFLDRFLANLEGFFTAIEDKTRAVQMLFDVRSAPQDALEWLASWFGVALDPAWDEVKRRLFIKHAMDFFQYRGTIRGLQLALRLALDACVDERLFNSGAANAAQANRVRIVEKYRIRRTPGVVLGDPTDPIGLPLVALTDRWVPAQGANDLHRRYRLFLQAQGQAGWQIAQFPPVAPADPTLAALWQTFAQATLGFIPAATAADQPQWQDFLARRYQRVNALNTAYRLSGSQQLTAFSDAALPDRLPPDVAPLQDWYQFESVVLAMRRTAHRFTVLLPAPVNADANSPEHQQRLDLATRIINLEKPAQTIFDVKFYWALFRIGAARLGEDTLLDLGSRAPQLMPPLVVGQGYLSESYLAPGFPQDVPDRTILGRDRLSG